MVSELRLHKLQLHNLLVKTANELLASEHMVARRKEITEALEKYMGSVSVDETAQSMKNYVEATLKFSDDVMEMVGKVANWRDGERFSEQDIETIQALRVRYDQYAGGALSRKMMGFQQQLFFKGDLPPLHTITHSLGNYLEGLLGFMAVSRTAISQAGDIAPVWSASPSPRR